jgi:electron transfer flavoprotein alpha subunit
VELGDADLVVGVGRGFENQEDLAIAQEVAEALGAEMACSRPIAEFFKWLPEDRYLGISGQTIRSRLYLAAGISGQVQHLYGIRDVKTIVAVNTDQNAPIFKVADYFVVGDVKEFLPAFKQAVLDAKG